MSSFAESYIYLVGGMSRKGFAYKARKSAFSYSIQTNEWEALPKMNIARALADSCILGDCLYVFCGRGTDNQKLSSIERLFLNKPDMGWYQIPERSIC